VFDLGTFSAKEKFLVDLGINFLFKKIPPNIVGRDLNFLTFTFI